LSIAGWQHYFAYTALVLSSLHVALTKTCTVPIFHQTWALYDADADVPVPCSWLPVHYRVVVYLPGKAGEPPASQGNLRTVRWPRGSTTTCSYCCTGRLSWWTLWSKSSEFRTALLVVYSPQAGPRCINLTSGHALLQVAVCLPAQHPADRHAALA
jgi:hypothetical protein